MYLQIFTLDLRNIQSVKFNTNKRFMCNIYHIYSLNMVITHKSYNVNMWIYEFFFNEYNMKKNYLLLKLTYFHVITNIYLIDI